MSQPLLVLPEPEPIEFFVVGLPAPQGSHQAILDKAGRPQLVDGGSKKTRREHRRWRKAVAQVARAWLEEHPTPNLGPLDEPLEIRLMFLLPLPESDRYRSRHAVSPDLDKLCRSTLDSLTDAELVADDSRFFAIRADKSYARPGEACGCRIRIVRRGHEERADRELLKAAARAARRIPVPP